MKLGEHDVGLPFHGCGHAREVSIGDNVGGADATRLST